jgi:TonB family protein
LNNLDQVEMYRKAALLIAVVLTGAGNAAHSADPNISQRPDVIAFKAAMDPANGSPLRQPILHPEKGYHRYTVEEMGGYFPERAMRMATSGAAVVQCSMATKGDLSDCTLLAEVPVDFGFGEATLKMVKGGYLSAKPDPADHDGQTIRVVVAFKYPGR